jgi:hypothetical protein
LKHFFSNCGNGKNKRRQLIITIGSSYCSLLFSFAKAANASLTSTSNTKNRRDVRHPQRATTTRREKNDLVFGGKTKEENVDEDHHDNCN